MMNYSPTLIGHTRPASNESGLQLRSAVVAFRPPLLTTARCAGVFHLRLQDLLLDASGLPIVIPKNDESDIRLLISGGRV